MVKEWNVYKVIFLGIFIFTGFLLILLAINPASTGAVMTYGLGLCFFFVLWMTTDPRFPVQLTVTVDYNKKYFWLQKAGLTLTQCVIVGLVLGSVFAGIIGIIIHSTNRPMTGVPRFLGRSSGSLSATGSFRDFVWGLATGASKSADAFNHSWIPMAIEEPLLIGVILMISWSIFMLITKEQYLSGVIAMFVTAFIFPNVWHIFAYQGMESNYWSAFTYALVDGFLVVLTGNIFVGMIPHFVNNYLVTILGIIGLPFAFALPPLFAAFIILVYRREWFKDLWIETCSRISEILPSQDIEVSI